MAKHAVFALVFASLLVASMAIDGRGLKQKITYDCDGAKQINTVKNACNLLCSCAGSLNKQYATDNMKKFCINSCNSCTAAAQNCKAGSALPKECEAGRNIKEVNSCISTFLQSRQG